MQRRRSSSRDMRCGGGAEQRQQQERDCELRHHEQMQTHTRATLEWSREAEQDAAAAELSSCARGSLLRRSPCLLWLLRLRRLLSS